MDSPPDILVVEDDADTRADLCDLLGLDGYDVVVAATAAEARSKIRTSQAGIVILDVKLPDGTGEELLPEFLALAPSTDIVVVTGVADTNSKMTAVKNGAADYILKPINPDALRTSIQRIASRRRIEQELFQEHEFAHRVLRAAEAIVLVLDLNGSIVRFNPYFCRVTGRNLSEMAGEDWFDNFLPADDRERIREVFKDTARGGMETSGIVNPILTREGLLRQVRWSNTPLKNEAGETTAVLAIGLDVTDLVEAQKRAIQSERLAAIGQTMTALAHESRNALQRIQASSDLLGLELEGNARASEDLQSIRRAATDLHRLLEEVRAFAAPIKLKLETVQLSSVWMRAWTHLKHLTDHRDVTLRDLSSEPELVAELDSLRIEQVFRNLFENSLAACADPVSIDMGCESLSDGQLEITVSDNGPGLRPEQERKIFEDFYTTKDTGTGLGMAIVKRIVESHHGQIFVDKGYELGAKIVIRLPKRQLLPS